jgi:hypothetical protein
MPKELKAIAIFLLMLAVPIIADNFIHARPDVPLFGPSQRPWLFLLLLILAAAGIPAVIAAYWKFEEEIQEMESWLTLAERELLKLINDGWDQTSRLGKVKERAEWNAMAQTPFIQIFKEGYRTVAHEAFELNRQDMANRGATMGKAGTTAALLRELYQGSVSRAKAKVAAEQKNGGAPFVAPGIRELIGFDKPGFPGKAGVDWLKLTLAVEHGQFPRELILVNKTDKGAQVMQGWEVIRQLTQQRHEDWEIPPQPRKISMWRLWLRWLFTIESSAENEEPTN